MRRLLHISLGLAVFTVTAAAIAQTRQGLLPVDQAYKVSATIQAPGIVVIHWTIAPHYYLYRGRMKFMGGKDTTLGKPKLPAGKEEYDQYLGEVNIYHNSVTATVPYKVASGATSVQITVGYQGCHEVKPKLCYPPTTKAFNLALPR